MKTDRAVVITGAAGGMGTVFVRRFLDNGDTVIATDTSADSLAKLADSMNSDRLHIRAADITDEAPVQSFLEMTAASRSRLHYRPDDHRRWRQRHALKQSRKENDDRPLHTF